MGIEIYEEKAKNRKYEKETESKSPKEVKEAKERETEVENTARLCAQYHDRLDPTGYFGRAAANVSADLLPGFLKIKKDLLPESLQNVITHRIIYLSMMTELKKESKLLSLLDKLAPKLFGSMGIFNKDFEALLAECKKIPEFNKLTAEDFKKAYLIVVSGVKHLQPVTKGGWQEDAKKYLQSGKYYDKRVDDQDSAMVLRTGLMVAAENFRKLKVKRAGSSRGV